MTSAGEAASALAAEVALAARRPGARRTLILDLDGTLAPIAPTPEQARVPAGTLESLSELARGGFQVAVVSGRPLGEVRERVPIPGVRLFGCHGAEDSLGGLPEETNFGDGVVERLGALAAAGAALAGSFRGAFVEKKPYGVAFHDRGVAAGILQDYRREVGRLLRRSDLDGLFVVPGRRVVEVRAEGFHKGRAVEALIPDPPAAGLDESILAAGDDRTDEDLFLALRGIGLTVRIGRRAVPSAAARRLPSPSALARTLAELAEVGS